jgi:hypothetical protein
MRLLYVVDGRSPIALNWIKYFLDAGHEVHLATTFSCEPELSFASLTFTPVAFSESKSSDGKRGRFSWMINVFSGASFVNFRTSIRQKLGPFTIHRAKDRLKEVIEQVNPQLIHAMRIPYEGMLVTETLRDLEYSVEQRKRPSFLVSVWGNDFTLHASSSRLMTRYTRDTLLTADALHTDCLRDQRLAYEWGFRRGSPAIVLPGGGGVNLDVFSPSDRSGIVEEDVMKVINPRGVRAYIRNDTFFHAAKLVLKDFPHIRFVCTGMAGEPQIKSMISDLGISANIDLLPQVPYFEMPNLFKSAQVAVSLSTHDGTPNTLLEAMACGCFPIAGDIESLREWIVPDENGLLVDPDDPNQLAEAILLSLKDRELRLKAAKRNTQLIADQASYQVVMANAEKFYRLLIATSSENNPKS